MFTADAHCDTLYELTLRGDRPCKVTHEALAAGDVGIQTFALFAGEDGMGSFSRALDMLRAMEALPLTVLTGDLPETPPDAPHAVLSVEGCELFEGSLERVRELDGRARPRLMALTWNFENQLGYPAVSGEKRGLKPFGRDFLRELGRRRVLADVSHLNEAGFWDVCEHAELPPVASHSNCRWLCDTPRNLKKEQARAVIERGGFIGVNFYAGFLRENGTATIDDVVRHIDALMELGGEKSVGFGSDFDGISAWPEGLETPADFPRVLSALAKRGYPPQTVADIAGGNFYRTLRLTNRA